MSKAGRKSKFDQLRSLRKSGKTAFDAYQVDENNALYEEVDETQYKRIVRDRLNQDDFVVDDNGEGYADDGREEWDRTHNYSDSDDGQPIRERKSKKAREDEQADRDAKDRDIAEYFTKGKAQKTKIVKTEDDALFLDGLLSELEPNLTPSLPRLLQTKRSAETRRIMDMPVGADSKLPAMKRVRMAEGLSARAPLADNDDDSVNIHSDVAQSDDVPMSDPAPSSPTVRVASRKIQALSTSDKPENAEVESESKNAIVVPTIVKMEDEDEDMMEVALAGAVNLASVNVASARPAQLKSVPKVLKSVPSEASTAAPAAPAKQEPDVDTTAWTSVNQKLNVVSSPQTDAPVQLGKIAYTDALEDDGSLLFFWTDFSEVGNVLCLFGKVLNRKTGKHVSCFVKIDNILRKLFFLPRATRVVDGVETDEPVGMADVYAEIDALMTKAGVKEHKTKRCTRKYAFELPHIPREGQYLKLLYPYTKPALTETVGETFAHVFGAGTAIFEQFVLWKNVMGPCWLRLVDANFAAINNASHCKLEVLVEHPNMVSVVAENDAPPAPPLTLVSLALRTVYDDVAKKQEVLAISGRIYENVALSDPTPADKLPCRTFTVIRPSGAAFPVGFETLVRERTRGRGSVRPVKSEAELLSFFLAQMAAVDPDVLVGHQLEGVDYSVLLERLRARKTPQWSRIGRFKRQQWPSTIGRVGGNVFAERQILSGRLLCDLANDAGRSMMSKCQSYSLTEMCALYLGAVGATARRDIDSETALRTWASTPQGLVDYVGHMEADTYYIAALALKVQILALTKVLTNLAGNSWARTLTGTRAERNEYILLHEFHRNKYILPDKQTFRGRATVDDEAIEAEGGKKRDKYKGGLVFEPERGLYDKYVLVMDFNSLYPSIIQEYNICFTTVQRTGLQTSLAAEDGLEEAVPDVPKEQAQGVLPRLIAGLVSRRKQVKGLMKDKKATPEQLAMWDIRQLALKLTANSMYGCLGYTKSRFYARPLAVLVTFKGREILKSTKELAEEKALQVIYGDTDSVMINANVDSVTAALAVGQEFKRAVNERYRLLEIDIDNIFRRILLQAKKKYAAVNMVEVGGAYTETMEIKGLDMKRREYCALSKDVSKRILDEILSGNDTEQSIARIHDYLRETAAQMRAGDITADKFIIFTQLGKDPGDYPNAESMPQVQVALREAAQGRRKRKGDVIAYIVATGETAPLSEPVAKRAFTPVDVRKTGSGLVPDVEWYIGKQLFPPVERLCANIRGTSTAQLAECLGLDARRYAAAAAASGAADDLDIHPLETQTPDAVRFADCTRLRLCCRVCKTRQLFEGLAAAPSADEVSAKVTAAGFACGQCDAAMPLLTVVAQVEHAVRSAAARYHEGWLVCNDAACGMRTRQMSVFGTRCLGPEGLARDCMGQMRYEISERQIYNQLLYMASLFDIDRAKACEAEAEGVDRVDRVDRELVRALAEHNRRRLATLHGVVEGYLERCGRRYVAMDQLFAKVCPVPSK